uniref:40S ribosomal protein S3 n=1 Tax=Entamoeba histolytica TaxID=5759 RepID=S0AZJ3_ENTHI|nr:40S ribosomal protein S3, putative [Entamoeba histolytica]
MFCLTKTKALNVDVLKTNISRKHKFVADGVFYAELNELLQRELSADGYSGVEVRKNGSKFQIIIRATRTTNIIGDKGRRIHELTNLLIARFGFPKDKIELYVEKVLARGLCPVSQAESIKYKIAEGLPVRRAVGSVMRLIMDSGAKGCEVSISGKLRGQRAQGMVFKEGYMIKSGNATRQFYSSAARCVLLRMGIIGIKVTIMLDTDPSGKNGPAARIPDVVEIKTPKDESTTVKTEVIPANKQ